MYINLPDKMYYKIGEVAKAFKVKTSLIRYWEKEFSSLRPKKNKNGSRVFTKKDIEVVHEIYHLIKEKGFTHEGAKQKLKEKNKDSSTELNPKAAVINRLEKIKHELEQIKNHL